MFDKRLPKESFLPPSLSKDESQQQLNNDIHKLQQTLRNKSLVIEAYNGHGTDFLNDKSSFVKESKRAAQSMIRNFPKTYFLLCTLASFFFFPIGFYAIYWSRKVSNFYSFMWTYTKRIIFNWSNAIDFIIPFLHFFLPKKIC